MIFSRGRRGAESELIRDGECAYKTMGTLTSYVGALDAAKSPLNGSAGFSWINITSCDSALYKITRDKISIVAIK